MQFFLMQFFFMQFFFMQKKFCGGTGTQCHTVKNDLKRQASLDRLLVILILLNASFLFRKSGEDRFISAVR